MTKRKTETLSVRCKRLIDEAEHAGDDTSAQFFAALQSAVEQCIPELLKETCLILLLNRKLADVE